MTAELKPNVPSTPTMAEVPLSTAGAPAGAGGRWRRPLGCGVPLNPSLRENMSPGTLAARERAVGSVPSEKVWGPLEQTEGWRSVRLVI